MAQAEGRSGKGANIYNIGRKLRAAKRRVETCQTVPRKARDTILRFLEDQASRGLSAYRQVWYVDQLLPFAEDLGVAFLNPSTENVKQAVGRVEASDLAESYKANKRTALKRFYKWLLGNDEEYPPCVKWVRTTAGNGNGKLPEDLPTREEVQAIIDGAISPRDKALIAVLADGGLRIGEALNLRVKDFHEDHYGGYLIVPTGKTGARRVRLVDSVTQVTAWIRSHPLREDGEAFLFIGLGRNRGTPLKYAAARKAIRAAAARSGIPLAKVNPHNFRHYAGTRLAAKVAEAPLEQYMGWVHGSKMSKVYVHLSGRDVDEAILKAEGVPLDREEPSMEKPTCPRCQAINPEGAQFCYRCSAVLAQEAAAKVTESEEKLAALVERLVEEKLKRMGR